MANTAHVMQNIANDPTTKTRIEFLSRLTQEELDALNEFYPATPRPWAKLMRGVRVENNTVIISLKGGNDAARQLCNELIREMEA